MNLRYRLVKWLMGEEWYVPPNEDEQAWIVVQSKHSWFKIKASGLDMEINYDLPGQIYALGTRYMHSEPHGSFKGTIGSSSS